MVSLLRVRGIASGLGFTNVALFVGERNHLDKADVVNLLLERLLLHTLLVLLG
jgi:hypothetical protein